MSDIHNPVLRGFNPDPSILRVGNDYYIATSTFEWWPGVQLHHSRDLVNWEQMQSPLSRLSQLNMIGNINSGGIWAPCLSYSDGLFYLIYTDVKSRLGAYKDAHNYLVTAENIEGPWSDPVYLNSSGFDPSLFHDDDGKKWILNMIWDHRKGKNSFAGTALQEYSVEKQKLVGPVKNIFKGTDLRLTEAPHLYKRNGYYYLMTAEGGTSYKHAVTMARSKNIFGPYEVDPANPVLTSYKHDELTLQKAGHASIVETQNGEWYLAHLCGRPVKDKQCILGRETAIQKCYWTEDGWIRTEGDGHPRDIVPAPDLPQMPASPEENHDNFDGDTLKLYWNALRQPFSEDWMSLSERKGYLRLKGAESLRSTHRQSVVARRLDTFHAKFETKVEFDPKHFQHMAGLIAYYDTSDHAYLRISHDEEIGKNLNIIYTDSDKYDEPLTECVSLSENKPVYLKGNINRELLQFSYSLDGEDWNKIGKALDISHLSDDNLEEDLRFTGTFVGMCCQDLSGTNQPADFDYFYYERL
ncbi:glycoside hydrolase family 43 protein [Salibacterium salarium]|uniref:Glycoside hydrolase family 43 protein n=1 Tax=Salibacterium salarium TaxID=284579 RepID=A0A428N0X9_9BACI|nr:glycoside hydrolase family 43 protein [Salibacterium salarium]RSL32104.1 glycoside hydrolase family 43 protein [Salibacterium salarium]